MSMHNIHKTFRKAVVLIEVDIMPGDTITESCDAAIELATEHQLPVRFTFNGVEITATASDSTDDLIRKFRSDMEANRLAYLESPEGKQEAERLERYRADNNTKANQLVAELQDVLALQDEGALVAWIGRFADVSDYVGLDYNKQAVATALESAGYVRHQCVGDPEVKTDKTKFARWLIGQAIDNLRSGMGIHPIATKFAADYLLM